MNKATIFACYVCTELFPIEFKNDHHKIPKSMGGGEGENLLALCAGCHQFLHAIARMIRNPKRIGDVTTSVKRMYPASGAQHRCVELANLECKSRIVNREAVEADVDREVGVGLKLTTPYRNALQLIARDRKISMAKYARLVLESHIREKYPQVDRHETRNKNR